jgi:hypothetical protein
MKEDDAGGGGDAVIFWNFEIKHEDIDKTRLNKQYNFSKNWANMWDLGIHALIGNITNMAAVDLS